VYIYRDLRVLWVPSGRLGPSWAYWRHKSYWDIRGLRVLQGASGSPGTQGPSMEVRAIEGYLAPFSAVETVKMFETIGGHRGMLWHCL
jgi:hypothetical protein